MKNLFLSPHNDDAVLFGAFTLIREKPLVVTVTDSWIQFARGESCTAEDRWKEDVEAMKVLNCSILRLGFPDTTVEEESLEKAFRRFVNFEKVYIPALQGGNVHHDMVNQVGQKVFKDKCVIYPTYTKQELYTTGEIEIVPTTEESELKNRALDCYVSQIRINRPHFDAVRGKSEWLTQNI